jgi:hypothetical protein
VQVEGAGVDEARQPFPAEPAVVRAEAHRRVQVRVGIGLPERLGVGGDHPTVFEMAEGAVPEQGLPAFPEHRFLARGLVGDGPEVIRTRPGDPAFVTAADRRVQMPAGAVVDVDACWHAADPGGDQGAAVGRPELDVPDRAEWLGHFGARRDGLFGMPALIGRSGGRERR